MEITTASATIIFLTAAEGKVLTDGITYARQVALPSQEDASRWTEIDAPEEESSLPTVCTKYEFVKALEIVDSQSLQQLRSLYAQSPELQFYWNTVQVLDRNNSDFQRFAAIMNATTQQLDDIFRQIEESR